MNKLSVRGIFAFWVRMTEDYIIYEVLHSEGFEPLHAVSVDVEQDRTHSKISTCVAPPRFWNALAVDEDSMNQHLPP